MKGGSATKAIATAHFIMFIVPTVVSAQSLDTRTAIYILSGIAGLYTLITCFCFIITVCICCKSYRKSRRTANKYKKYEELEGAELSTNVKVRLSPLHEEPELAESPATVGEDEGTFIENKYAIEHHQEEKRVSPANGVIATASDKQASIIVNKFAHDIGAMKKEKLRKSPFARHTPKILPRTVQVYPSDDASSVDGDELEAISATQILKLSWTESGETAEGIKNGTPSIGDNKELRMRKVDSSSHSAEKRKTTSVPSSMGKRTTTESGKTDKTGASERSRLQVGNSNSKYVLSDTDVPKTSPLPRSGQTKHTGEDKTITLLKLHTELSCVKAKWYYIGIQLRVSKKTLGTIRVIHKSDTDTCLMRVCEEWLQLQKKSSKVPEWSMVVEVLRSGEVYETELADSLHHKYCSDDESTESEDDEEGPTSKSYTWIN